MATSGLRRPPDKSSTNALQFESFTVLIDTVIDGVSIFAVCHQSAGTNSSSPGRSSNRPPSAFANSGNRSRSGWSRLLTVDRFRESGEG
jgi:hypothetical protein